MRGRFRKEFVGDRDLNAEEGGELGTFEGVTSG